MVLRFLNLGGHEHFIIGSKLTTILMVFFVRNWMFVAAGQTVWIGDFWSKSIFLILETSDPFCLFAVWMIFFIWFFLGFLVIAELWFGFSAWLVWTNEKAKRSFQEWTCLHHKVSPLSNDPVPLYNMYSKLQNVNIGLLDSRLLSRNTLFTFCSLLHTLHSGTGTVD